MQSIVGSISDSHSGSECAICNMTMISFIREIQEGIPVYTDDDKLIGTSSVAAKTGIFQVAVSRILMATPTMSLYQKICFSLLKPSAF